MKNRKCNCMENEDMYSDIQRTGSKKFFKKQEDKEMEGEGGKGERGNKN